MKKVLIADDHSLFSLGISSMLMEEGYEVVGTVDNGNDVLYKVISLCPDILILDLNLPHKNGVEILTEVKGYSSSIVVVIITMYNEPALIKSVRKAGANAYFLKNSDQQEVLTKLRELSPTDFFLSRSITDSTSLAEPDGLVEDDFSSVVKLTNREKEILKLLVEGKSSKEIADELDISSTTVDTHRKNMLKKLSFNKVSELVSYAYRNNLV